VSTLEAVAQPRSNFRGNLEVARQVLKNYPVLTVTGLQWGDEGKGKLMDFLAADYDITVRYSGGANAGHTIFDEQGVKFVTHLMAAGALRGKPSFNTRGVFFKAQAFRSERDALQQQIKQLGQFRIDRGAPLWTSWHPHVEMYLEHCKGADCTGTTNQGIVAFAFFDSIRMPIRVDDCLRSKKELLQILRPGEKVIWPWLKELKNQGLIQEHKSASDIADEIMGHRELLEPYLADASDELCNAIESGSRLLLEGAQGTGLDNTWGTVPYTSLGKSVATAAAYCCGIQSEMIGGSIGVFKPIVTRVGEGPFMSEIGSRSAAEEFPRRCRQLFVDGRARVEFLVEILAKINAGTATENEQSQFFQVRGLERGATTNRGRSVGHLDLPWLKYAIRKNGSKFLAMNKIDMLDGLKEIKVVVGYKFNGELLRDGVLPDERQLRGIEAITKPFPGWKRSTYACEDWDNLPFEAQSFTRWLEIQLGQPIVFIGTGPWRNHVIFRDPNSSVLA